MKVVSKPELVQALMSRKGSNFIGFDAITEPEMRKTSNPFLGKVEKRQKVSGETAHHYANKVNKRLESEGKPADFEAQPMRYGERIKGTPLVVYEKSPEDIRIYLHLHVKNSQVEYYWKDNPEVEPTKRGQKMNNEEVKELKDFFPKKYKSRQGLEKENEVFPRNFTIIGDKPISIKSLRIDGEELIIGV